MHGRVLFYRPLFVKIHGHIHFNVYFIKMYRHVLFNVLFTNILHRFIIKDFNPITVWILNESKSFHATIIWTFNELDSKLFEAFTSSIDILNQYTNVSKSTGLRIAIVIALCGITFSTPIAGIICF